MKLNRSFDFGRGRRHGHGFGLAGADLSVFKRLRSTGMSVVRASTCVVACAVASIIYAPCDALAGNEVFVCTDASGTRTYQNTGATDQCRKLNVNPVLSIPQPAQRSRPLAPSVSADPVQSAGPNPSYGNPGRPPVAAGAATPGVTGGAAASSALREPQGSRDADRLRILEGELRDEERRLQLLQQRQLSAPDSRLNDDIARSQASLDALRREIAKVRRP